jgi:hypothetical protein
LVAPGSGTTGSLVNGIITFGNVDGYRLKVGSPAIGTGKLIPNNGGRDYWNNPVSASNAPNIGAYNGPGIPVFQQSGETYRRASGLGSNKLHPSPVESGGKVNILYNALEADDAARLDLVDLAGRVIASQKMALTEGVNAFDYKLPDLSSGLYYVILAGKRQKETWAVSVK